MSDNDKDKSQNPLYAWFCRLSTSKKVIIIVFVIWAIQAVPKWTLAITADGELSSKIMMMFITPRYER